MRKRAFKPSNLREAFQVIAAANRAMSGVAKAGRDLFDEIAAGVSGSDPDAGRREEAERSEDGGSAGDPRRQDAGRPDGE